MHLLAPHIYAGHAAAVGFHAAFGLNWATAFVIGLGVGPVLIGVLATLYFDR